ncbi:MAG: copper-translocating P-type ATPase [Candidatus Cloacimonetes bacterium]|nr:copper-translocating P-type ATPase [Candidatus Cloacimonadota bacterium]
MIKIETMKIGGMTCASCSASVEKALKKVDGVSFANVNLATEKATVKFDPDQANYNQLLEAVHNSGYEVVEEQEKDKELTAYDQARKKMIGAWLFTIPIALWMIPEMFFNRMFPSETVFHLGMIFLAIPVLFIIGRKTYISAFRSITHGSANMDVLIALGTGAAFFTGLLRFFLPIASFAGVSAMIMSFHLTGRYIESKAKGKASQAIRKLLELGAKTAIVIRSNSELEIPIEEVIIGDIMLIKPGSKIPTDGEIIVGKTTIDESMATGESMPIKKRIGDKVIGATINQSGLIKVKATKIGKDTFLSQIIKMVEETQGSKVPIQEFADKVTGIFVPVVILLAILTFISWLVFNQQLQQVVIWASNFLPWVNPELSVITQAVFATVAVLVIACPCALGLATPTALMVGSGMGAQRGILIRKGEAIQTMKQVKVIVFDKTGTITKGKPEVTDIIPFNISKNALLQYAASIEAGSEHPLASAIVEKAKIEKLELFPVEDFQANSGKGISGKIQDKFILIGNRKMFTEEEINTNKIEEKIKFLEDQAKTVMIIGYDNKIIGLIAVADSLKDDSISAISKMHKMGVQTVMLTGDNEITANAIAKKVGIDYFVSDILPERKVAEIIKLQDKFGIVAMVGDGINDAPALKQANIGIAIGTGTDIAIESADITLILGNLSAVITAIKLSRATFKKIKQNLFWAFAYNIISIPIALLGLLHPIIAEIAMAISSITVVTNANLLRKVKL